MTSPRDEVIRLTNLQIERGLDESEHQRFNELLRDNDEFVSLYVELVAVHGQLLWGAGLAADTAACRSVSSKDSPMDRLRQRPRRRSPVAVAATLLMLLCGWVILSGLPSLSDAVVEDAPYIPPSHIDADNNIAVIQVPQPPPESGTELRPLVLDNLRSPQEDGDRTPGDSVAEATNSAPPIDFSDAAVVDRIDRLIADSWQQHELTPSPTASDQEWIRRACLSIVGRIPTLQESTAFLASDSPRKRQQLIDDLIESTERSSHLAVVWANMLIGRTERRGVNRSKLFEFLLDEFQQNAPWIDTVGELITASGRNDRNGATNFLLAHLNNEATPATAVTARLFLGEQMSCLQCHDHPFARGIAQSRYWALNAFFKDTDRVTVPVAMTDSAVRPSLQNAAWKLVDRRREERMTFFENRAGRQQAVLPAYDGHIIPADSDVDRREELARLLAADSESKVAKAMVNRMWAHFFGYGFTNPIDDMGPHSVLSHPELLDSLTDAFVASGYDLQRLMRWVASSQAWQLSSEGDLENTIDCPEHGLMPLFSRVYVRRMTPEQVYESIRVAVRSVGQLPATATEITSKHRREWVRQFARAYETDENDEAIDFDGTIAQAMVMMNGGEVDDAIRQASRAIVEHGGTPVTSGTQALERVALAMLTRQPTSDEERVFRRHYRQRAQGSRAAVAIPTAVEDMMWAYLNSSEFVLVH
ncbi:MAG: DUF1549 domain-containing protein [Fuerstiella sp.]|nr:DUF1549 domain-containing protein [Fuerstiella sp.]MCP4854817.1 DUF1549 domain-containing protein [Fuerstiella sp.]